MTTHWKHCAGLAVLLAAGPPLAWGAPLYSAAQTRSGFLNPPVDPPMSVSLVFADLPTPAAADGLLTVTALGDLDDANEFLQISADGLIDFGPFLNSLPDDDRFDNQSFNDRGLEYTLPSSAGAVIPLAELQGLVADGQVEFRVVWTPQVSNLFNDPDEFITLRVEYRFVEAATLAGPATSGLLAAGLSGLAWRRRPRA